jgi:transposase
MRKQRTHFDKAFKENAVKLSLERKNVSELAQELGIAPFLLYRWRKEYRQKGEACFPGHGVQSLTEDSKRIAELGKSPGAVITAGLKIRRANAGANIWSWMKRSWMHICCQGTQWKPPAGEGFAGIRNCCLENHCSMPYERNGLAQQILETIQSDDGCLSQL